MFSVGEKLTSQEMTERLGITRRMWDTKRQKYLDHLAQFYKVEQTGYGMSRRYVIKEQIGEYEPYISSRDKKAMEKKYQEVILDEISKPHMNLQLYSTMNDRVMATGETARFSHKPKTSYNYVNAGMKEMFGAKEGEWGTCGKFVQSVWAKQLYDDEYDFERLTETEAKNWSAIRKKHRTSDNFHIISMMENHEISYEEAAMDIMNSETMGFHCAREEFFELYGFVPVWVKEYLVAPEEAKLHVDTCGFVN